MEGKDFTTKIGGVEAVTFKGLIALFHKNGGQEIITTELEPFIKGDHTMFRFMAMVKGDNGTFTGHGDAAKFNVGNMIKPHIYRMAETRAIARALRLYNNIGTVSDVELGGKSE